MTAYLSQIEATKMAATKMAEIKMAADQDDDASGK
jgi:hypothetical protein